MQQESSPILIPLGTSRLTSRRCATRPGAFGGGGGLGPAQPATTSNPCEAPQALRSQPRRSQRNPLFLRRPQALEKVEMTDNTLFYTKNRDFSSEKTNK